MQKNSSKTKACQSRLKEHVVSWAKCAVSFHTDSKAISVLLGNLKRQLDIADSVSKTLKSNGSNGKNQYNQQMDALSIMKFPALKSRLLSRITIEIETTLNILKSYQKGLGDVFIALQFAAYDANQILTSNSISDIQGVASILIEMVLDIQQIQWQFEREYQRKKDLLQDLMIEENSSTGIGTSYGGSGERTGSSRVVNEGALRQCMEQWDSTVFHTKDTLLLETIVEANVSI